MGQDDQLGLSGKLIGLQKGIWWNESDVEQKDTNPYTTTVQY